MAPTKTDPWIRLFDVSEPSLHNKGYTVYKVVSTVFPRNCPEAATQLIAWKRFSDFKRLHRGLNSLHASLHLKGTFPRFPKDKVFGRFEPDVIEERRQSALQLLEFVAQFPPLFTSQLFVKFFEGCKRNLLADEHASQVENEPVLQPELLYELPINDRSAEQSPPTSTEQHTPLGGVWQYCRATDDVSLDSTDDSDNQPSAGHDPHSTTDQDSLSSPPRPSPISAADMVLFDPLSSPPSSTTSHEEGGLSATTSDATAVDKSSSSWLLSALAHCQSPLIPATPPCDKGDSSPGSIGAFQFPRAFADLDDESGGGDDSMGAKCLHPEVHQLLEEAVDPVHSHGNQTGISGQHVDASVPLRFDETWTQVVANEWNDEPPGCDYLLSTARLLTSAQEAEAGGEYERAFDLYKSVVGTLLSGVQEDLDPNRRDAVRRKTAQYLQRAEEIYQNHLAGREADQVRWAVTQDQKSQFETESQIKLLKSPPSELGRYKVLGVVGKVMLVLDSFTDTPLAIKVLTKSAKTGVFMSPWVVPSTVPWMVRLVRFHETEESIFLVLQHAVGGKLWHYIGSYLQGCSGGGAFPINDARLGDQGDEAAIVNVYTGRKLIDDGVAAGQATDVVADSMVERPVDREQECVTSYVRLFTDSGAACRSRGRSSLAECRYVAARFQPHPTNRDDSTERAKGTLDNSSVELDEPSVFEDDDDDRHCSWTTLLANVDPDQLISNAQKLMQHVDETMRESNRVAQLLDNQSGEPVEPNGSTRIFARPEVLLDSPRPMQPASRRSSELSSRRRRQTNEDAFPCPIPSDGTAPPACAGRRSSATSLELKSRVRHFSSVFRRLDDTRNSTISVGLPETCIRVWAAEIAVAISSLHDKGIICRDLKPDNVLLGERGHIMLSYFSQWPSVEKTVDPFAKECYYAAPEIGGIFPVTNSCDWWSLGALMFELLTGKTLVSSHPGGFTSHTHLNIPCPLSTPAQDLLRKLLCFNSNERLDMEGVKAHAFFAEIDWKDLTSSRAADSHGTR